MISPSLEREAIVTMPSCTVREDAEDHPAVPERVDERNALVLERLLALADGARSMRIVARRPEDPRADDAGRQADSDHATPPL